MAAALSRAPHRNETKQFRGFQTGLPLASPHTMRHPDSGAAMKTLLAMLALLLCLFLLEQADVPSAQADECGNLAPDQTLQCAAYGAGNVVPE